MAEGNWVETTHYQLKVENYFTVYTVHSNKTNLRPSCSPLRSVILGFLSLLSSGKQDGQDMLGAQERKTERFTIKSDIDMSRASQLSHL